jgi:5'-methylthioadenosine phosphorylase
MKIAVIGSSDIDLKLLDNSFISSSIKVNDVEVNFDLGFIGGNEVYFFYRNLKAGSTAPHAINYRFLISAIKLLKIKAILGVAIVGSLKANIKVGSYAIVDQFIDFTKHREFTIFTDKEFAFTDLSYPYCSFIRDLLRSSCMAQQVSYIDQACYFGVDGPRFNTVAEIKAFEKLGGDIIGMSNIPEVIMARESGICYALLALVVDYAAGVSNNKLSAEENSRVAKLHLENTINIIRQTVEDYCNNHICNCN